jgi:hypothetical protein
LCFFLGIKPPFSAHLSGYYTHSGGLVFGGQVTNKTSRYPNLKFYDKSKEILKPENMQYWERLKDKDLFTDFYRDHPRIEAKLDSFILIRHFFGLNDRKGPVSLGDILYSSRRPLHNLFRTLHHFDNSIGHRFVQNGNHQQDINYRGINANILRMNCDIKKIKHHIKVSTKNGNRRKVLNVYRSQIEDTNFIQIGFSTSYANSIFHHISSHLKPALMGSAIL